MKENMTWVTARYIFPTAYSIRVTGSSMSAAVATPAPGPGTVRLALIRKSFELYGKKVTREILFRPIMDGQVEISPPREVGISQHLLKMNKVEPKTGRLQETIGYREYCHSNDPMLISIKVPRTIEHMVRALYRSIGYWGQANSFTQCISINNDRVSEKDCIKRVENIPRKMHYPFVCFLSDFEEGVSWEDFELGKWNYLSIKLFVFPYDVFERHFGSRRLAKYS